MRVDFDGEKVTRPEPPKPSIVAFTFATISFPATKRRRIKAYKKCVQRHRWRLNRFGCVRTLGRKNLKRLPRVAAGFHVQMADRILVPTLTMR